MKWPADAIVYYKTVDLIPYVNNARVHSESQVAQIAASIKEWGFTNPILIDEQGGIIAGHGRVQAAKKLKIDRVPCVIAKNWTEAQKKAYVLADNQLAQNSSWDDELLSIEIEEIKNLGFSFEIIGFDNEFLNSINEKNINNALDDFPELADGEKQPFQQKTFMLHDEQAQVVDDAITLAKTEPLVDTGLNENSKGNALALICEQWLKFKNANS
jgi:ParB-like chromosome segregation protein Spo0J